MRILFWSELFWPYVGGVEVMAAQVLPELRRRGHTCISISGHGSLDLPDEDDFQDIPVRRFPFFDALRANDLARMDAIRREVSRLKSSFKPDVVHLHLTDPSAFFHMMTAKATPVPTVVSLHMSLARTGTRAGTLLGRVLESADWVTTCSTGLLEDLRDRMPGLTERSSTLYCGAEPPTVAPSALPFSPPVLLCVGRVVEEKGYDLALEVTAQLKRRGVPAELMIAGDGPALPALRERAAASDLAGAVDFLGWVAPDKIFDVMNRATLLLIPSRERYEALPIAGIQANMMGRPIVATEVGGLADLVKDAETGHLVSTPDAGLLADQVARTVAAPDEVQRMGLAARAYALQRFNLAVHIDTLEELYDHLVRETAA